MPRKTHEVTLEDFARSFGTTVEDIPDDCRELIAKNDFGYEILAGEERDKVILDVLKKIESDQQIIGAPERQTAWEKGWEENLQDFVNSGYGKAVKIKEIVGMILKAAGHEKAGVEFDASKPTTIPFRMVDTSKAKEILGFEPEVSLEDGLKDTVEWYMQTTKIAP